LWCKYWPYIPFFSARYPNAQIFAIEPDPTNFALLKANIAGEFRITPIQACVTGRPQHEVRFTTDNPAWGNRISSAEDGILVPATTITELCHQLKLNKIDLLKLDIEGAEQEVLKNGDFLAIVDHIVIEFHDGYGFGSFREDIEPYGLRAQKASPLDTYMVTAHR
jgi:FkbM family methyltransferase